MRTKEETLQDLLARALTHQPKNWFIRKYHCDFYQMKRVLEGKESEVKPEYLKRIRAAAEVAVTTEPSKHLKKKRTTSDLNPAYKLSKILEHTTKRALKRDYHIFDNTMKAVLSGRSIRKNTITKIDKIYRELVVDKQTPTEPKAVAKKPRSCPKKDKPNPRPDLLRDIVMAARDPQLHEVMAALAILRSKYNGKTESALALLARMEEDGVPLSVFAP